MKGPTHLAGFLDQQMGPCFANGLTIGPLSIKPFDLLFCVIIQKKLLLVKSFLLLFITFVTFSYILQFFC
jgi:hypothetical protein